MEMTMTTTTPASSSRRCYYALLFILCGLGSATLRGQALVEAGGTHHHADTDNHNDEDDDMTEAFRAFCHVHAGPGYFPEAYKVPALKGIWTPPPENEYDDASSSSSSSWRAWIRNNAATIVASQDNRYIFPDNTTVADPDSAVAFAFALGKDFAPIESVSEFVHALDYIPDTVVHLERVHKVPWAQSLLEDTVNVAVGRPLVDTDVYMASSSAGSYGWHYDEVDNLVVMVHGKKRFQVAGMELGSPTVVDAELSAGQAMWVPQGYYHRGDGLPGQGLSILFSVGFTSIHDGDANPGGRFHFDRLEKAPSWEYFSDAATAAREEQFRALVSVVGDNKNKKKQPQFASKILLEELVQPPEVQESWDHWLRMRGTALILETGVTVLHRIEPTPPVGLPHAFGWHVHETKQNLNTMNRLTITNDDEHPWMILENLETERTIIPRLAHLQNILLMQDETSPMIAKAELIVSHWHAASHGWTLEPTADQVIAVAEGRIHVRVAKSTDIRLPALVDQPDNDAELLAIDKTLKKGDMVFIPAGYYYVLQATHERGVTWRLLLEMDKEKDDSVMAQEQANHAKKEEDVNYYLATQRRLSSHGGAEMSNDDPEEGDEF